MTDMTVSETLNEAADLIQRNGWWSPSHCGGADPKCAANAILHSAGGVGRDIIAADYALSQHLVGRNDLGAIWDWNDAPGRTAEEVIATLRAAAVIAESRETVVEPATEAATR